MNMKPVNASFGRLEEEEQAEFEEMVLGLYREDPAGEAITREKIGNTVRELDSHPEKGAMISIAYPTTASSTHRYTRAAATFWRWSSSNRWKCAAPTR